MRVQVKLMGTLRGQLPPEAKGVGQLDLEPGATVATVLERLGVAARVHAVMVNDELETDRSRPLAEGDSLVLLPPVAGG
jgi:molybdopterin converting factor small subunit